MESDNLAKKLIYCIIDTTPRQKFIFVIKAFNLIGLALVQSIKSLILNYKSFSAKAIYASFVIHILALGGLVGFENIYKAAVSDEVVSAGEVELTPEQARQLEANNPEIVEITGIYYISPEDLLSKKIIKPRKHNKPVNTLLAKLKGTQAQTSWKVRSGGTKASKSNFSKVVGQKPIAKSSWQDIVTEKKSNTVSQAAIENMLNKHLLKYNEKFKSCYEAILLKDSSLNAKINFLLKVGQNRNVISSKININGVGLPESKSELRGCLTRITKTIRFPSKSQQIAGQKVKFQVVLNSWD